MKNARYVLFLFLIACVKSSIISAQQETVGSLSKNVKVLEVDYLTEFNQGAALVFKGIAHGLLDGSGNFVIPFNRYRFNGILTPDQIRKYGDVEPGMLNYGNKKKLGLFSAYIPKEKDGRIWNEPYGILNSKGKLVYSFSAKAPNVSIMDHLPAHADTTFLLGGQEYPHQFFVDINGKRTANFRIGEVLFSEGLTSFPERAADGFPNGKYGFKNSQGQIVIKPMYTEVSYFSEGLCAAAKANEFGELKWGFIDRRGQVVIPFMYTNKPSNFHQGLAYVKPVKGGEYKLAFINKANEIRIKISQNSEIDGNGKFLGDSKFYYLYGDFIMDTSGKFITKSDILREFNLSKSEYEIDLSTPFRKDNIFIRHWRSNRYGVINLETRAFIPAVFSSLSAFDPISQLAYAELEILEGGQKRGTRKGYINREGVFVIVKG